MRRPLTTPAEDTVPPSRSAIPIVALLVVLAGCGTPPELRDRLPTAPPPPSSRPASAGASSAPVWSAPPASSAAVPAPLLPPAPPPPAPAAAVPCPGRPTNRQVLATLRTAPGLPDVGALTVTRGPLCADGWQFTEVQAGDADVLLVVTRGRPDRLRLVEVGTEVCSDAVQADAPPAIRALVCSR